MNVISVSRAREKLYRLIDSVSESHQPVKITGKRNKAVIISEEDYNAIQETLYLVSITMMRESILEGIKSNNSQCSDKLDW
ncbi:MAG: type II toxin-antitoxin system Phd/YefM family antitoxin [Alphaproteobacteria bacterium]|nr:type II toxin-antitoxin system Phd/YefM family antitoxin [Alphaproteobacteria bacterium]OJV11973.1 MAG: antitoxin [Alphaproteobacteria bacterium 33-17]